MAMHILCNNFLITLEWRSNRSVFSKLIVIWFSQLSWRMTRQAMLNHQKGEFLMARYTCHHCRQTNQLLLQKLGLPKTGIPACHCSQLVWKFKQKIRVLRAFQQKSRMMMAVLNEEYVLLRQQRRHRSTSTKRKTKTCLCDSICGRSLAVFACRPRKNECDLNLARPTIGKVSNHARNQSDTGF